MQPTKATKLREFGSRRLSFPRLHLQFGRAQIAEVDILRMIAKLRSPPIASTA
jgi:hypothetical protein